MPQTTFAVTANADDAWVTKSDALSSGATRWPPTGGASGIEFTDAGTWIQSERSMMNYGQGRLYWLTTGVVRFDTSAIPDGSRIRSATLQFDVSFIQGGVDLKVEWYAFDGSIALSDWTSTISGSAATYAAGAGGDLGVISIPLTNPQNVNTTGYTGFRTHIQIPTEPPTGENSFYAATIENATRQEPRLIVDYDIVNTFEGGTSGTITAANSGGASGVAFTTVNLDVFAAIDYTNSPALSQGVSCLITPPVSPAASPTLIWDSTVLGTLGPSIYSRCYFCAVGSSWGSVNNRFMALYSSGTLRAGLLFDTPNGQVGFCNSANSFVSETTMRMQLNTVYRIECLWTLSATVGQAVINVYLRDSTTVLETLTSAATQNFGGTTMNEVRWGSPLAGLTTATCPSLVLDGLGLSTTGYMGAQDGISLPTTAALSGVSQ